MSGAGCSVRHMSNDFVVETDNYVTDGAETRVGRAHLHGGHPHHGGHHHGGHHGGPRHVYSDFARFAAEALGTFMLVLALLASLVFTVLSGNSWLVIALTVGMMLAGAMAAVGHVTGGGEFNPAVTIGKAIAGRLAWRHVLPHIFGQIVGAALAGLVMWAVLPHTFAEALGYGSRGALLGTTAPGFGPFSPLSQASSGQTEFGLGAALLTEIIFTALLVAVVLGATRKRARRSGIAPLVVGMTYAALLLITWPITRGSLNPARAFGSVMLSGDIDIWRQLWLFILGPLIGAALAGLFYRAFGGGEHGGFGSFGRDNFGESGYTVNDVADPVYVSTAAPVVEVGATDAYTVPASSDAYDNEMLVSEPVEHFVVTGDEVVEDGDAIVFGRDAETVADILEADEER